MQKTDFVSLTASSTVTNKQENQDCHFVLSDALIVTDGLGSFAHAKTAAEFVASYFKSEISARLELDAVALFADSKKHLIEIATLEQGEKIQGETPYVQEYGTTAIAVIERINEIICAYVGNGAIWHIRGNFNEFPTPYLFPWNAINYLNPHSIPVNGKEALYRLISNNTEDEEAIPTVIKFSKDDYFGDIIMICTDGVYSADQFDGGTNSKGVWVKYEESMLKFFSELSVFFSTIENFSQQGLQLFVEKYLDSIKANIDDDATIAVLISSQALAYSQKKLQQAQVLQTQQEIEAILKAEPTDYSDSQIEPQNEELNHEPKNTDQSI
jgi:serine/threonine protein phosphatase PrpC